MNLQGASVAVTGGASGLGLATAQQVVARGALVTLIDLAADVGESAAAAMGAAARFVAADVTDEDAFAAALDVADDTGPLRAVVHCAGAGRRMRILDKDGKPGSLEDFEWVVRLNLIGSFNALRLGAARMARHEVLRDGIDGQRGGERGAIVLTASVAAYEGQIGQINYAAS